VEGYYCNFTYCINFNDTVTIAKTISKLLCQEYGIAQIDHLPYLIFNHSKLRQIRFWERPPLLLIGIASGSNGWSIIKCYPNEWLILRAFNNKRIRLWNLATTLKRNAFFYSVTNDIISLLVEVNSQGRINYDLTDRPEFSLINVPESFAKAIRVNPEFVKREDELFKQFYTRKDKEDLSLLSLIVEEFQEGDAERSDIALGKVIDPSESFWGCYDFFSRVYLEFNELNKMNVKLLYFQLPNNHLDLIHIFYQDREHYLNNEEF
jgi:hypothetical protein